MGGGGDPVLGRTTGVPRPGAANGHQHSHVHVTLAGSPQHLGAAYPDSFWHNVRQETGTISLFDASRILLEHGDHDLYLG
jgi:hypothetical protein